MASGQDDRAAEVWTFDRLDRLGGHPTTVVGNPQVVETPIGKAVEFDGIDDALFVDVHPLEGAKTFTWEAIFRPDGGSREQRWFHLQETGSDNRMLFEIRVAGDRWYLDSFNFSSTGTATLMNKSSLHPLGAWYHVAAVYDGKVFRNYVNGVQDGAATVELAPQGPGRTAAGVRINLVNYFKGAIHSARFTRRALAPAEFVGVPAKGAGRDWPTYLGDKGSTHYSSLKQIDISNVAGLQVAWTYETGDKGEFQTNNLVIDGVLYTASPQRKLIALDAATGRELWTFDPKTERDDLVGNRQRGLAYWAEGDDRRIFTSAGTWLYAVNARTGMPVRSFGDNGSIHLGRGVGLGGTPSVRLNTPGVIYKDLLIVGGLVSEQTAGAIRAFDVRTGELRWTFRTIPRPGEFGYDTWPPDAWKTAGGASDWSGHSVDEARGIVYLSTETAGPDFWGGDRYGENLFANSIIALNADTGERLWHYQVVRHDLWDLDLPAPPTLLTVTHEGRRIDAVAQGTKHGLLFVFDRVTGKPLWPIHDRPAHESKIAGVRTWPTQPFPEKPAPLIRQIYTSDDVSTISADARALTTERFMRAGSFGAMPPPSVKETILFPGPDGGFEWGGAAADPDGILYANVNEIPWFHQMIPTRGPAGAPVSPGERQYLVHCASCHGMDRSGDPAGGMPPLRNLPDRFSPEHVMKVVTAGGGRMPPFAQLVETQRRAIVDFLFGTEQPAAADAAAPGPDGRAREGPPYAFAGFRRWFDREGYPAIKPPWGTLNAVDLNTGEIKWKVPLGEYPELTKRGIPPTGTENYGGPVVTAGGLIFIGATADETFRAFDKATGRLLWQAKLPFSGTATPSTYLANGRQYVVISAGGGKSGRPAGGTVVAFALPD